MNNKKQAFTLVELIVVITILAILGTIAFISLQGYSAQSRDSARLSDLSVMKTSLELFQLDAGKYPIPTDGVDITYSGGVVWNQGTFGDTVFKNIQVLDKLPTDPLGSSKYTYSVTSKKNEYEIAGIVESDIVLNVLDNLYAGEADATAFVTGNFNGIVLKSLTGGVTCSMLSTPSIIVNNIDESTDLVDIIVNSSLVYNGYKNLPHSYKNSRYKFNGGFSFTPNRLLVYNDSQSCEKLTEKTGSGVIARVTLIKGLQESYSGTSIEGIGEIKVILGLGDIDINDPTTEVENFAGSFVNNHLGGSISIISGDNAESGPVYICNGMTQTNIDNLNSSFSSVTGVLSGAAWCAMTSLNLSGEYLGTMPIELGSLTNLTNLDISFNSLTGLPSSITNLTNLTNLNISGNPGLGNVQFSYFTSSPKRCDIGISDGGGAQDVLCIGTYGTIGPINIDIYTPTVADAGSCLAMTDYNVARLNVILATGLSKTSWCGLTTLATGSNGITQLPEELVNLSGQLSVLDLRTNVGIGTLSALFNSSTPSLTEVGITQFGEDMTIIGGGTVSISVN